MYSRMRESELETTASLMPCLLSELTEKSIEILRVGRAIVGLTSAENVGVCFVPFS